MQRVEPSAVSLARVQRAAKRVRRLEDELDSARRELREAMVEAHSKGGETIAAMAVILGVSRQRAARILNEAGEQ
jgi:uncharacterized protein (UPF0335 family)